MGKYKANERQEAAARTMQARPICLAPALAQVALGQALAAATAAVMIHVLVGYAILNAFDIRPGEVVKSSLSSLNVIDVSIPPVVGDEKPGKRKGHK